MSKPARVVIAEDNYLVREGTRRLLEDSGEVEVVVSAAAHEHELIEQLGCGHITTRPDLNLDRQASVTSSTSSGSKTRSAAARYHYPVMVDRDATRHGRFVLWRNNKPRRQATKQTSAVSGQRTEIRVQT